MADTVAPMITDATTTTDEPAPASGGVAEERYLVRDGAGEIAVVWCADTSAVAFEVRFIDAELAFPVRLGAGATVTTNLSVEVGLGPGAAAHELADWLGARLGSCESESDAGPARAPNYATVSFGVSGERGRVTLAWNPGGPRAYYTAQAQDVNVRVPAQVERSPGRANVDADMVVPLAGPEIARELVAWIRATIPNEDWPAPEPEPEVEAEAEPDTD